MVVLESVIEELKRLSNSLSPKRAKSAKYALEFAYGLKRIPNKQGKEVDDIILNYAYSTDSIVATMDLKLKKHLRKLGVPVISMRGKRLSVEGI